MPNLLLKGIYLIFQSTAQLTIVNANAQMAAGPLVLYVVWNDHIGQICCICQGIQSILSTNYISANPEVYEAEGMPCINYSQFNNSDECSSLHSQWSPSGWI